MLMPCPKAFIAHSTHNSPTTPLTTHSTNRTISLPSKSKSWASAERAVRVSLQALVHLLRRVPAVAPWVVAFVPYFACFTDLRVSLLKVYVATRSLWGGGAGGGRGRPPPPRGGAGPGVSADGCACVCACMYMHACVCVCLCVYVCVSVSE